MENEEFIRDVRRVRSIARERVSMFDAADESYGSDFSRVLFAEYLELRDKYGRDSIKGRILKAISDEVWDD
jgi:hypothetical protein